MVDWMLAMVKAVAKPLNAVTAPHIPVAVVAMELMAKENCPTYISVDSKGATIAPIFSLISPKALDNAFACPASVLRSSAFMLPTFCVMTSASMAARSDSVPYFNTCSCAALKVMPTRESADTCPCITFPMRLPTDTASLPVALNPLCCATRLFIAGIRVSSVWRFSIKVAICCAPISCTSSPMMPSSCCAEHNFLMASISPSVACIRCFITVASFTSASCCTALAWVNCCITPVSCCKPADTFWKV